MLGVPDSSIGRARFVNWTCPIHQLDVPDASIGRARFINRPCPIHHLTKERLILPPANKQNFYRTKNVLAFYFYVFLLGRPPFLPFSRATCFRSALSLPKHLS